MNAKQVAKVVGVLECGLDIRRATLYVSPTYTVKATRQRPYRKSERQETVLVTAGRPNYLEREVITILRKCKEPFPVKKVQVQYWPRKRR